MLEESEGEEDKEEIEEIEVKKENKCQHRTCICVNFVPNAFITTKCNNCEHINTHFATSTHSRILGQKYDEEEGKEVLKKFNILKLKDFQKEAIKRFVQGEDVVVAMKTGSGKSLCYEVPAVILYPQITIVILPSRALLKDKAEIAQRHGFGFIIIQGEMSSQDIQLAKEKLRNKKTKIIFIFVIPECIELAKWAKSLLEDLFFTQRVARVVVDEADFLSNKVNSYRPTAQIAVSKLARNYNVPIMALTACHNQEILSQICASLNMHSPAFIVNRETNRDNFSYFVEFVPQKQIYDKIVDLVVSKHANDFGLIFCQTIENCIKVALLLQKNGIPASEFYRNMPNKEKKLEDLRTEKIHVLVATNSLERGVNFTNTTFVIHLGFPITLDQYYQETGRIGRQGQTSVAYIFWNFLHQNTNIRLSVSDPTNSIKTQDIHQMISYVINETECRHILLSSDDSQEKCTNRCDNCLRESDSRKCNVTNLAHSIVSLVKKFNQEKQVTFLVNILKGSSKVNAQKYCNMNEFGIGKDFSANDLKKIIIKLVGLGYLTQQVEKLAHNEIAIKSTVRIGTKKWNPYQSLILFCDKKKEKNRAIVIDSEEELEENEEDEEQKKEEKEEEEGEGEEEEEEEEERRGKERDKEKEKRREERERERKNRRERENEERRKEREKEKRSEKRGKEKSSEKREKEKRSEKREKEKRRAANEKEREQARERRGTVTEKATEREREKTKEKVKEKTAVYNEDSDEFDEFASESQVNKRKQDNKESTIAKKFRFAGDSSDLDLD